MSTQAILERERRYRRLVVVASILPLLLLVGAAAFQSSGGGTSELATATLRTINENAGSQLIGSIIAAFAFLLLAVPLAYHLQGRAGADRPGRGRLLLPGGPRARSCSGFRASCSPSGQIQVADQFVAQESGVGDIYSLATTSSRTRASARAAIYV